MLYTVSLFVALLMSAVMSQQIVTFSSSNNFGALCSTNNEISEIDGSDTSAEFYYCIYNDVLVGGDYKINFYNENGEIVYSIDYSFDDIAYGLKVFGGICVDNLVDNSAGEQSFTLKFEKDSTICGSGSINIINLSGAIVSDMGVRLTAPTSFDQYGSNGDGSYGNGETIVISSQNSYGYFCSIYSEVLNYYKVQMHYEGVSSGVQSSGSLKEITSSNNSPFSYYYCDVKSFQSFSNDESIKVTSYLYDSNDLEVDSMTIIINYSIETPSKPTSTESTTTTQQVTSGYCEEKPGKSKQICQSQQTQAACESYNKCQWVNAQ
jgi:hypothetical protein